MKTKSLLLIAASIGIGSSAFAQEEGKPGRPGPERPTPKDLVEKFDKDGDGALSADELQAAMDERKERMDGFRGKMEDRRKEFMEKFDTDKDGKLSEEERAALPEDVKERMKEMKEKGRGRHRCECGKGPRHGGPGGRPEGRHGEPKKGSQEAE